MFSCLANIHWLKYIVNLKKIPCKTHPSAGKIEVSQTYPRVKKSTVITVCVQEIIMPKCTIKDNNCFAVDWIQYFGAEPPEKENS